VSYIPATRWLAPSILTSSSRFASAGVVSAPDVHEGAGAPAPPLITLTDVAKTYGTRDGDVESLKPLSFDIAEGEFMAIVGPSGCGKSTLLKMIGGLLPVSQGRIALNGHVVSGPPDDVGFVFQSPVLLAWRTVLGNVMLQIEMRNLPRDRYLPKARALLKMVGLEEFERKLPWQLSGGMQQRASICRALVHDPAVLLMDEPFGALDAMTRERMNLELQRIWSETRKTVLFITHSIPEAVFLADRVLVMTERPGSIAGIYDVPLPRPRSLAVMGDPTFVALTQRIRKHFFSQGTLDG
jgi:NitT/TauT family transport system ATP-binding protein